MTGMPAAVDMSVTIAGRTLRNPLVTAAGTAGYVRDFARVTDPRWLGAITTKSITPETREGNRPWRIIDARAGMLNAIGLANVGLERFLAEKLAEVDCRVIGSVAGHAVDDYVSVAAAFDAESRIDLVELNLSCPNTDTGRAFGASAEAMRELLGAVRPALATTPMIVKLAPDAPDVVGLAAAAIEGGADALTLVNTMPAMAIDVETRQPRLSRGSGGLSGPALHPIAVRIVHEVHDAVARDAGVPIIGLGGVMSWREAAEFILAGASATGVGTALFVDPRAPAKVAAGLEKWVRRQGCVAIRELIGQVEL